MGPPGEVVKKLTHVLVYEGMIIQEHGKAGQLFSGGQPVIDQKEGRFHKRGVLGQLFYGDAPVSQNAPFSVHKRYGTLTAPRIRETGIKGNESRFLSQSGDINGRFTFRSRKNGQIIALIINHELRCSFHVVHPVFQNSRFKVDTLVKKALASFFRHSREACPRLERGERESSVFTDFWTPAAVYPALDAGRE